MHQQQELRTNIMYNNMKKKQWLTLKRNNGKNYLPLPHKSILILDRSITDFCSEPLISVGASLEREIILLDAKNSDLQRRYQQLKKEINRSMSLGQIFDKVIKFVRSQNFNKKVSNNGLDADVTKIVQNWRGEEYKRTPIIPLEHFIQQGVGVCRHHALLVAFLLNSLMNDKLLPKGKIHHHRDKIQAGAHVVVVFQPDEEPNALYLVDSLWNVCADILSTAKSEQRKLQGYGEKFLENCKIYDNLLKKNYCQLKNDREKKFFIRQLLNLEANARRELLNQQYAVGSLNITGLFYFFENIASRLEEFVTHKNFKDCLMDLRRVLETENLHAKEYRNVIGPDNRQQFVLGLLNLDARALDAVLAKQRQHQDNLVQLKTSLNAGQPDRRPLYERFPNFSVINKKIDSLLEDKAAEKFVLQLEKYILVHKWKVGPQWKRCAVQNHTVPSHVAKQYNEIVAARNGRKKWSEAKEEIFNIGKTAKRTYSFFRKKDTKDYYNLFEDGNNWNLQQTIKVP